MNTAPGPVTTRFAPSPTGGLHIGHAYSALFAYDAAKAAGGRFLLRIEDIDRGRCRPEFETAIFDDLAWLGLEWEQPVRRQSEHFADYEAALGRLDEAGLIYPCFCTRKEIADSSHAPHGPAPQGPEGPLYPGTCRQLDPAERVRRIAAGEPHALRLDLGQALHRIPGPLVWHDRGVGDVVARPEELGDVVLARKDVPTSYHLAVTVDDALQGVTLVTRGQDLFHVTHIHRLLQALLNLPTPDYHHHLLLVDDKGRRLAKRHRDDTLTSLRERGLTPKTVRAMIDAHPKQSIF
jgi:glutamyl-Q tRNA(Asp) synthetase